MLSDIRHKFNKIAGNAIMIITYELYLLSSRNSMFLFIYRIHKKVLSLINITPLNNVSHILYAEKHKTSKLEILIKREVGYSSNRTFDFEPVDFNLYEIPLNDVYLYYHKKVRIHGDSDFVININEETTANDIAYNLNERFELYDGALLKQKENLVLLRINKIKIDKRIESGIMLSGRFSSNYYHVMYELLIKLILLDDVSIPKEVPIVVDEIIFEINSFKEIFNSLNHTNRDVILIKKSEIIEFENLYCISSINLVPPHYKRNSQTNCFLSDCVFDVKITEILYNRLSLMKSNKSFPKRFFISRRNTNQRRLNEDEIISVLGKYNISIITPEDYSFSDQIALFSGAELIIGGSGAAFSNLLFCKKDTFVICIVSQKHNSSTFTTIAYSRGVKMIYCLGKPIRSSQKKGVHSDLIVEPEKILKLLRTYNLL